MQHSQVELSSRPRASIIAERPLLGHGYAAFWQPTNQDAQALFRTSASHMGFNFHNQFIDAQVDLGLVGLVFLVATLIYVAGGTIWRATLEPLVSAAFMASLVVALYVRLPVESTLLGAWTIFTFLWLSVGVNAYARNNRVLAAALPNRPSWGSLRMPRRAMPPWRPGRTDGHDALHWPRFRRVARTNSMRVTADCAVCYVADLNFLSLPSSRHFSSEGTSRLRQRMSSYFQLTWILRQSTP